MSPSPLWDLLELPAALDGDRRILRFGGRVTTTADLRRWAVDLAGRLDGRPIALLDVNSDLAIALMYACMYRGTRFVPLNYRLRPQELEGILIQAEAGTLVYGGRYRSAVATLENGGWAGRTVEIGELCDPGATAHLGSRPSMSEPLGNIILFTSGTSSAPKPIPLDAGPLSTFVMATTAPCPPETRPQNLLLSMPLYHVAGIVAVLRSIFAGRCVTVLDQFDPERWTTTVERTAVTHAFLVPTMLQRLLDGVEARLAGLTSLVTVTYGGGPMPAPTIARGLRAFPESVGFVGVYGLTEASGTVCVLDESDHSAARAADENGLRRLGSVGRPVPDLTVEILDEEGRRCEPFAVGEIFVRGPRVSSALGGDGNTNPRVLRTGDLGYVDEAGYLFFKGRVDDMIVRGGENIAPREIEDILRDASQIREVAVFGVPDEEWGQRIVAAVVLPDGTTELDTDALRDACRSRLAGYKWPSEFLVLPALPMTPTGKVIKREIAALIP